MGSQFYSSALGLLGEFRVELSVALALCLGLPGVIVGHT